MRPLAGTDAFQVQLAIGPSTPDATTLENFQRLVDHCSGRTDLRLADPAWTSLWRANVRMVDHYRTGRVLVAGDAAHVHTPAGGQGMNTGVQDARRARGATCRLFDVFRGPRATLLAFGEGWMPLLGAVAGDAVRAACIVDASSRAAIDDITFVDTDGHARAAWEPGDGALFIVRPDGVIGLACDTPDADAALDWLRLAGLIR